ncbi:16S rRNA (adenine(1518)-N(6)/adenine(1519)-N(6))-dimethyltransferase RsmA [Marichromatium bheemlicum]|uniref:Ribosomal RNA small subunit methyltransferase A n=1 Tax=Marichromatium bheemlicum TaxID=365339 RepID=A0ABX1I2Y5_9GAMM|nr:16S rRNA (adenine(1518)-N(6)/adenine(1519)-N(6))-dimethyltransferase RsmA [Marichromatium bheemlicum]NKN31779.1 16S rRNA (adenine(1518)-N(6)/adenine(1519)-N(6))-dimethyltransferase RsmA [Marichromatium bheemlicum]
MLTPHQPRKRFGQNFLHDQGVIARIHAAIAARPGERLVEIGPGQGAITAGLLEAVGELDVVELDRDLIEPLRARLGGRGTLRIHNVDALKFDLCALRQGPEERVRVVGNLPYNISTPLLFHFLDQSPCLADLHLMLQKEVVDRMVAEPGSKTYGRLSVMVQTRCHARSLFRIGPGAFTPAPKVDSAIVRLEPAPELHSLTDPAHHARIVAAAFSQRRKTLRNSLSGLVMPEQFAAAEIDPGRRAETLSVTEFATLANAVACQTRSETED